MTRYTPDMIAERLTKAVDVYRRLPRVPKPVMARPALRFLRTFKERWAAAVEHGYDKLDPDELWRRLPPTENELADTTEALRWLEHLDDTATRKLMWLKASGKPLAAIGRDIGLSRSELSRRWRAALITIATKLNGERVPTTTAARLRLSVH